MQGSDWKHLIKDAVRQGWRVARTSGDHYQWLSPDGTTRVITGSTISDRRAFKNTVARLRRGGFNG